MHHPFTPLAALAALALIGSGLRASEQIPGAPQSVPIAVVGATLHPVVSADIPAATIVFDGGRIVAMGKKVALPKGTRRVDASGKHVYPGLIDASSSLGLIEIPSVRATVDSSETGQLNPNVRAETAVNPDSELIPVARAGGVLLALSAPSGGLVSGTSALLMMDGWTAAEMTLKAPVGMHVRWPRVSLTSSRAGDSTASRSSSIEALERALDDARAYRQARAATKGQLGQQQVVDRRWQALLPVIERRLPLVVAAESLAVIESAVSFAARQGLKIIIVGGYDAPEAAVLLKKHEVPVIIDGVYRLPNRRSDPYDAPYSIAGRLHKAGVRFCIAAGSDWNARNLAYHAGVSAAYGLPHGEALKAITRYPAEILGVADRVGSLAVGLDATLIVTDGDPLETSTRVVAAYIQGRAVDLSTRQTELARKYEEKYRQQSKLSKSITVP